MKLVLDNEEFLALLIDGLKNAGFDGVTNIELDVGENTKLPLDAIMGLEVHIGLK